MSNQVKLQIGSEFLDLVPGTVINLEEENIFLQLDESVKGDFSMPFEAVVNEKNLRLTDYNSYINATGTLLKEAILWDGDVQHSTGMVKLEKNRSNLNDLRKGRISLYYLKNASSFYQLIKDKRINELNFNKVTFTAAEFGLFYSYMVYSWYSGTVDTYDFTIFPVMGDFYTDIPNKRIIFNYANYVTGGTPHPNVQIASTLPYLVEGPSGTPVNKRNFFCPYVYLKKVLQKIFEEVGWKLTGSFLDDPAFKKAVILNFKEISFPFGSSVLKCIINPAEYLPNMLQSTFLIQIQNRLGIWFDFDSSNKTATIRYRKEVISNAAPSDITSIVSPRYERNLLEQNIIYSIGTVDDSNNDVNLKQFNDKGAVMSESLLPAAAAINVRDLYFIISRNKFVANVTENGAGYKWTDVTSNVLGVYPEGNTKKITTGALIPTMIEVYDNNWSQPTHYYMPYIPDQGLDIGSGTIDALEDSFYLCFYHGIRNDKNGRPYPYGSPYPYDVNGNRLTDWSLSFLFNDAGTERGLYQTNWKPFLDTLTQKEKYTFVVYTDIASFRNLSFGQTIVVNNVQFYLQNKKSQVPFNGFATLECSRIV